MKKTNTRKSDAKKMAETVVQQQAEAQKRRLRTGLKAGPAVDPT